MFKLIGCFMTFAGSAGFGLRLCSDFESHIIWLRTIAFFLQQIANLIESESATIPEAIRRILMRDENCELQDFMELFCQYIDFEELAKAWEKAWMESFMDLLSEKENRELSAMLNGNAHLEKETQKAVFDEKILWLKQKAENEKKAYEEKQKTIKSAAAIIGALICIVLW